MSTQFGSFQSNLSGNEDGWQPLLPRRPFQEDVHFDITAMIDLVFMMNIFFLVTTITAALADIDLPTARNCVPADRTAAVVITILSAHDGQSPGVYIGDDTTGEPLVEPGAQQREVLRAVEEGVRSGLTSVIIRAEKEVLLRETMRIARTVGTVEGATLKISVAEKE
jgi:biopolymer transport protein ExbD